MLVGPLATSHITAVELACPGHVALPLLLRLGREAEQKPCARCQVGDRGEVTPDSRVRIAAVFYGAIFGVGGGCDGVQGRRDCTVWKNAIWSSARSSGARL